MTMTVDTKVLLVGPAKLYFAAASPSLVLPATSADVSALAAGTFTGFKAFGETTKPTMLKDTPQFAEVHTLEQLRPSEVVQTGAVTTIDTEIQYITFAELAQFAQGLIGSSTYASGQVGLAQKLALALVGPWGTSDSALYTFSRVVVDSGLSLSWDNKGTSIPFTLKVLSSGVSGVADYNSYLL